MTTIATKVRVIISLIALILMITNIVIRGGLELPTLIFTGATLVMCIYDSATEELTKWIWGVNTFIWFVILVMALS